MCWSPLASSLKPTLLDAIRREADPSFNEEKLDALLTRNLGASAAAQPMISRPAAPAIQTAPAAPKAQAVPAAKAAPAPVAPVQGDYTERVIRIIMDATGMKGMKSSRKWTSDPIWPSVPAVCP